MADVWQDFRNAGIPGELVSEVQETYEVLKEHFYLGRLRPGEVEGGRFAEAVVRVLQWATGGCSGGEPYTPLSERLPRFDREVERLRNRPSTYDKSLRVRIPRVLHSIYDVRNGRDAAHLSGEVDPNLADSTLVATNADWVLAELIRLFHGVDLDKAQARVNGIVERKAPVVEMFGDVPKVLRPELSYPDKTLLILYNMGQQGATVDQLAGWLKRGSDRVRQTLRRLDDRALVHFNEDVGRGQITALGLIKVEDVIGLDLG